MQKYEVVNYIEICKKDIPMDSLPAEAKRIASALQDSMMVLSGFRRKERRTV